VGKPTAEGDSPVTENDETLVRIPSSTRHVKPGVNLEGPPSKAKYLLTTDSVIVA
jgi:hypothetical protein